MIWFVRVLKGLAVLSLLLNMVAYCISIAFGVQLDELDNLEKAFLVLSNAGYIFFCILLIIAEFEPLWFIKRAYIFHYWFGRGFCHIWMGVVTISTAKTLAAAVRHSTDSLSPEFLTTFAQVVGWILISVGALFCIMSVLCIRKITGEDDDLEEKLLRDSEAELGRASTAMSATDALLISNMAMCLGMTENDCRKRFTGSKGAAEAKNYAKQQQDKLAAAGKGAVQSAAQKATDTKNSLNNDSSRVVPAPGSSSDPPSKTPRSSMYGDQNKPTNSSVSQPTYGGGESKKDDDDWGQRRGPDDDQLMKMYYGGGSGDK